MYQFPQKYLKNKKNKKKKHW